MAVMVEKLKLMFFNLNPFLIILKIYFAEIEDTPDLSYHLYDLFDATHLVEISDDFRLSQYFIFNSPNNIFSEVLVQKFFEYWFKLMNGYHLLTLLFLSYIYIGQWKLGPLKNISSKKLMHFPSILHLNIIFHWNKNEKYSFDELRVILLHSSMFQDCMYYSQQKHLQLDWSKFYHYRS